MTEHAHTDLDTLQQLRVTLVRYGVDATQVVREAQLGANRIIDQITTAISERALALAAAQEALRACSQRENADCSGEAQRVQRAEQQHAAAKQAFATAQTAISAHDGPRQRYVTRIETLVAEGTGTLIRQAARIQTYLDRASSGSGSISPGNAHDADGPAAAGGLGANGGDERPIPGAPDGFALVPLSSIDTSDSGVRGHQDFGKGYSPDDLAWAHHALHEQVLPAMRAGKGPDYFHDKDNEAGRGGSRSLADTYSGFFGDSAIKLERQPNGTYSVGNGYHRIWVAQQLGLTHVPARVR
jgi:hypothetical protein